MHIEPLTGTLGAIVHGLELHEPEHLPWPSLRAAWLRHRVLFFREQALDPRQLVAFARPLGTLTPAHPLAPGHPEAAEVLVLDSAAYELGVGGRKGKTSYNNQWHTDVTFAAEPPAGTALLAVQVPQAGGDTVWADLIAAHRALSPGMQRYLESLGAVHSAQRVFGVSVNEDQAQRDARLRTLAPVLHPVVRVHPETGERGLFVNPTFTSHIEGIPVAESDAVLAFLHAWIASPDWSVRWRWRAGDVALWDNRATVHFATADYGDARRIMHRVTLAGDRPRGA
jgi:alpha-ketoglutarate-dependent taurine dioxygenase